MRWCGDGDGGGRERAPADGVGRSSPARHRAGDAAYPGPALRRRPVRPRAWPAPPLLGGGHGPPRSHAAGAGQGRFPGRGGALRPRGGPARPRSRRRVTATGDRAARAPPGHVVGVLQRPDPAAGIDVIASLGAPGPEPPLPAVPGDAAARPALPVVGSGRSGGGLRMPGAGAAARGLARAALALDPTAVRWLVSESIDRAGLAVTWWTTSSVRSIDAVDARVLAAGRGVEVARLLGEVTAAVFQVRAHTAPAGHRRCVR